MQATDLTDHSALALLQEGEKDAFGWEGCGINWYRPERQLGERAGSQEVVYYANACSCKARVICENHLVMTLVLTSCC